MSMDGGIESVGSKPNKKQILIKQLITNIYY